MAAAIFFCVQNQGNAQQIPPFGIRVWDYPNKHFSQTGTRLLCLLSTPYPVSKAAFVALSF